MKNLIRSIAVLTLSGAASFAGFIAVAQSSQQSSQAAQSTDPATIAPTDDGAIVRTSGELKLIELYTSQGCSSCPPADAQLAQLSQRDDVLGLALHVTYWDRLGWPDRLAQSQFNTRQAATNERLRGRRILVTPQMVVHGRYESSGSGARHQSAIASALNRVDQIGDAPVQWQAMRQGVGLDINLDPDTAISRPLNVHLVAFDPEIPFDIRGGELAGHSINYANAVIHWSTARVQAGGTASFAELGGTNQFADTLVWAVIVQDPRTQEVHSVRTLDI